MGLLGVIGVIAIVIGVIGLIGWIPVGLVASILLIVGGMILLFIGNGVQNRFTR